MPLASCSHTPHLSISTSSQSSSTFFSPCWSWVYPATTFFEATRWARTSWISNKRGSDTITETTLSLLSLFLLIPLLYPQFSSFFSTSSVFFLLPFVPTRNAQIFTQKPTTSFSSSFSNHHHKQFNHFVLFSSFPSSNHQLRSFIASYLYEFFLYHHG